MENHRVRLIIRGRVQGVWFRDSTRREALWLGVTGWVRNQRDGSVEVVAEGPEERLKNLISWCYKGPPAAKVSTVEETLEPWRGEFTTFEVVF